MVNENLVKDVVKEPYKYGFVTDIETEKIEKGLNEDIIRLISQKKEEPKYLLDFRLKAFKKWQKMDGEFCPPAKLCCQSSFGC